MIRSNSCPPSAVHAAELVNFYFKNHDNKLGQWSSPFPVLFYDQTSGSITIPGNHVEPMSVAMGYVRRAIVSSGIA